MWTARLFGSKLFKVVVFQRLASRIHFVSVSFSLVYGSVDYGL